LIGNRKDWKMGNELKKFEINVDEQDLKNLIWDLNKKLILQQKTIDIVIMENKKLIEENKKLQGQIDEYLKQIAGGQKE